MNVSIIIVNFNTKDLLANCLQSIYEQTHNLNFEIIVVDNASNDGSQSFVKSNFPQVILVQSKINLGFGLANNLGANQSKGEFLFFLNSDTILVENSVKILFDFFKLNEASLNIGVLGSILIDERFQTNGFGSHFPTCKEENILNLKKIPLIKLLMSDLKNKEYVLSKDYFEIDYVIGADMFMRKALFEKLNGFCKDFFMYYEESDLQIRIKNIGLKRYITTKTKIIHLEDGSGKIIKKYSNRKRTIVHKSKNIYLKKNDKENFLNYVMLDIIVLILNFLNFKYSFRENLNYFREIIKTY
ncbi:MAG: glycosyltransferase family 2 protein [Lutibacter sp.]|nr:glycosyltransferase family 2 protein [Lutibacter sp.]